MTVFEQVHGRHVWRLESTAWNGEARLQVWPWYREAGGELRPCAQRYGGGFAIPLDRVPELIAALQSTLANAGGQGAEPDNIAL